MLGLVAGKIDAHRDGYGFCIPDDGGSDLYLPQMAMRQVLHGDRVLARVARVGADGRRSGAIARVTGRAHRHVTGIYTEQSGVGMVQPHDECLPRFLVSGVSGDVKRGEHVVAVISRQPEADRLPECKVEKVLRCSSERDLAARILIETSDIPDTWPRQVLDEVKALPGSVSMSQRETRKDLTGLPLVTIDGDSAKDFDDAVWCEARTDGSWKLLVAIADVSYYVRPGTALDTEARNRGTSVYLPHRVLPMLPETLSNDLCSLRPKVPRLCHVCDMRVSPGGELEDFSFYDAVMCSAARLTYREVAAMMESGGGRPPPKLAASLTALYQLLRARQKLRQETSGLIAFDSVEHGVDFSATGKVKNIFSVPYHDSHKLIEECMLLANIAAARKISESGQPGIYRVHDTPSQDRLSDFRLFLRHLGLKLGKAGHPPVTKDYAELMAAATARGLQGTVSTMALRSMPLAVYSSDNRGHFGLGFDMYTHFTSPIRRYADLLVHRLIRGDSVGDAVRTEQLAGHCSQLSRRAEEAERDMMRWCRCDYLSSRIGEVFSGVVSGVCSFGLFVELQDNGMDGLVHVSSLPGDYYEYDYQKQKLSGRHRKLSFSLGQEIRVKLTRVDMAARRADLELLPPEAV